MARQDDAPTATAAPAAPRERPWLLATWPEGSVHCDLPAQGSLVIGRGDDCDLVVPHRSVSRRHARLVVGPPMTIEDLGSANGTKVRGRRLVSASATVIDGGLAIELGEVALLVRAPLAVDVHPLASELAKVERARIVEALERCGGNQTRAAALLGISRRTLVNRLTEYGLPRPLKEPR
jgi:Bacterial regulatory protein, Fis family/FHA domain